MQRSGSRVHHGFTLIELTIVIAVIGILAAIAIPVYNSMITKSHEGAVKGQLASIRSALSIYYSDNESVYPANLTVGLAGGGKYLAVLPMTEIPPVPGVGNPGHQADNNETVISQATCPPAFGDAGSPIWVYNSSPGDPCDGQVFVQCTHLTTQGDPWSSY